jgi:hypothetical protein
MPKLKLERSEQHLLLIDHLAQMGPPAGFEGFWCEEIAVILAGLLLFAYAGETPGWILCNVVAGKEDTPMLFNYARMAYHCWLEGDC